MPSHRLESLRERLLRAGIAPRHVRRYLRELAEHHEDALRAELAKGLDLAAARESAWERLGTEESLAQSMIERPELRSTAARFPALVFGLGPVLSWIGAALAIALIVSLLPVSIRHAKPSAGLIALVQTLWLLYARLLPVLLGGAVLVAAARRRMPIRWALAGTIAVNVLAGTLELYLVPGRVGLTSLLLPWLVPLSTAFGPRDFAALGAGLLRAAVLLIFSLLLRHLARRLDTLDRPTAAG